MTEQKKGPLKGSITVPGDKSISHRAVMLGALAEGSTEVTNFLEGADCLSTIRCFRQLGIRIDHHRDKASLIIYGNGLYGLKQPDAVLDVGNSGTTIRLLSGILSGQNFATALTGDASIRRRPMGRILTPLKSMEADIRSEPNNGCAPLLINHDFRHEASSGNGHRKLTAFHYQSPVASAQVKSCILLAGLYADKETSVTEPYVSRNHTELMLSGFGAELAIKDTTATVTPEPRLTGQKVHVPGDISSAAYFIAAALIVPGSEVLLPNVGINSTRDGILRICRQMGADITLENIRTDGGEPAADIIVRHSELIGTIIEGGIIPTLIDEIPILAVLACFAKGRTVIRDAAELKVKESNRIDLMVQNLSRMGADITATEDGMMIQGGRPLHGATIETGLDHRIAMSFAVASLIAEGRTDIINPDCVTISYPDFYNQLNSLM